MTLFPRSRLVTRLVVATVLAGAAAAAGAAALIGNYTRRALLNEIAERNAAVAEELAIRLDGRVQGLVDGLRVVATREPLSSLGPSAAAELRAVLAASLTYDELVLIDAEGRPVAAAAARFLARPEDYRDKPEVVAALSADAAAGWVVAVLEGFPPVLEVGVPVERPPGTLRGALLARVPLEVLASHLQQLDSASGAVRFLVDEDGRVLVHPERDRILNEERFPIGSLPTSATGFTTMEVEGAPALVAAAPSDQLGGSVVVVQSHAEALNPLGRQLRELVAAVVLFVLAAVVAISAMGSRLLAPLGSLAGAADRLGRGQRGVRVEVERRDEVGSLAEAFNRLARGLDRRQDQLEELQRLSLLVTSRADRKQIAEDLVHGATRLVVGKGCMLFTLDPEGRPAVAARAGEPGDEGLAGELAGRAARDGVVIRQSRGPLHAAAVPVATFDGSSLGALTVVRTDRPLSDEEVRLAQAFAAFAGVALENVHRLEVEQALVTELQDAVDRRRSLIGSVTHQFRTPIAVVEALSARLREDWEGHSDDQRRDAIESIQQQIRELDDLVTAVLEFSATERGTRVPSLSPVPLREPVASALASLATLIGERPIETQVPGVEVLADGVLLQQCIAHLVSNAVKYSPPGSPISIRAYRHDDDVTVEVTDEGVGIDPREAEQVFEPFWRGPHGPVQAARGAGLGLALVAEYVRSMGGDVTLESTPGKGSTFFLTLRAARPR